MLLSPANPFWSSTQAAALELWELWCGDPRGRAVTGFTDGVAAGFAKGLADLFADGLEENLA